MVVDPKPLRVLQLFTQPWNTGGAESHLATLIPALTAQGCDVILAGSDEKLRGAFPDIPLYILPFRSLVSLLPNLIALKKIVKQQGISIIHTHQRTGCVYGYFICLLLGLPYTVTLHDKWRRINRIYIPFLPGQAISISEGVCTHFIKTYHLDPKNITVIANGVNSSSLPPGCNENAGEMEVLHISRFSRQKGEIAIRLCQAVQMLNQKISGIRLTLVGHGNQETRVKEQAEITNGLCGRQAVRFLGERKDINLLLSQCTVAVGAGRVALEAMAAGKPVIAIADGDDFPGLIRPDNWEAASRTSWTRGPKPITPEILADEIEEILQNYPLQVALGEFGQKLVRDHFGAEIMAEKVIAVYRKVTGVSKFH